MAIEPYRRKVGIPETPGPSRITDTRVADIGPAISNLGDQLQRTFEPLHKQQAIEAARRNAGEVLLTRDAEGNLALPQAEEGGLVYRAAFDEVVEQRYLNEVDLDFQSFLNREINARRTGEKPFDPDDFEAVVLGRLQGVAEGIAPELKQRAGEVLTREALERLRTFRDEHGRTVRSQAIAGGTDQINFYLRSMGSWRDRGESLDEVTARYAEPLQQTIDKLRNLGGMGEAEADALFMQQDQLTNGIRSYVESAEKAATLVPAIGGMGQADLLTLEYWLRDIPVEGALTGMVSGATGASEIVTPDMLRTTTKLLFNIDPTSVDRPPDHALSRANPRSYHNTANGGRAVDMPAIPGMTIEQVAEEYRKAGFTLVEVKDEYKDPAKHATGGHWHFAFANTRSVVASEEIPDVKGLSFEAVQDLDPSVRNTVLQMVTDRRQVLREQEAEAAAIAREERKAAEEAERHRALIDTVGGLASAGFGGNLTTTQRGAVDREAATRIRWDQLHTDEGRATALSFVRQYQHIPGPLVAWFDNAVRSPGWIDAYQMYEGLRQVEMPTGAKVGDMLIEKLDARSRALFNRARMLRENGQPYEQIGTSLERFRSGDGFTFKEAKDAYGQRVASEQGRGYETDRNRAIAAAYGIPASSAVPAELIRRIDEGFAANLDLADRDPLRALQLSVEQNKSVMTRHSIFMDGVGPSDLVRNYSNQDLARFLTQETDEDGNPLLPTGQGHRVGGPQSTVKLQPLEIEFGRIGRYRVLVYDPKNRSRLIDSYELDLGEALNQWKPVTPEAQPDYVGAARQSRVDAETTANIQRSQGNLGFRPIE